MWQYIKYISFNLAWRLNHHSSFLSHIGIVLVTRLPLGTPFASEFHVPLGVVDFYASCFLVSLFINWELSILYFVSGVIRVEGSPYVVEVLLPCLIGGLSIGSEETFFSSFFIFFPLMNNAKTFSIDSFDFIICTSKAFWNFLWFFTTK